MVGNRFHLMIEEIRYSMPKQASLIFHRLLAGRVFIYASVDKILHLDQSGGRSLTNAL